MIVDVMIEGRVFCLCGDTIVVFLQSVLLFLHLSIADKRPKLKKTCMVLEGNRFEKYFLKFWSQRWSLCLRNEGDTAVISWQRSGECVGRTSGSWDREER